jgi:hypothetical protein
MLLNARGPVCGGENMRNLIALVVLMAIAAVAFADSVTTTVYFNVPSSISFTVTLPGGSPVASGATGDIEFNSSAVSRVKLNCTVRSSPGNNQTAAIPCFNYSNTGNRNINITLQFGVALPTQVKVKAGHNNTAWISSCTCTSLATGGCPGLNDCVEVNSTVAVKIATIPYAGYKDIWLWADFTNYMGGSSDTSILTHTSEPA